MTIDRIEIDSFGKFKDFSLDFKDGVNLIFGNNEAGKSTICAFLYAMFYDFPSSKAKTALREDMRRRYLPWNGENISGTVYFTHNEKKYVLKRKLGKTPKSSKVQLFDAQTWDEISDIPKTEIGKTFFSMGEEGFLKTLYLSQLGGKIEKGKNDEIIEKLTNLSQSGDEETSYQKTIDELNKKRYALISKSGSTGEIVKLKEENERERLFLEEIKKREKEYNENFDLLLKSKEEKEEITNRIEKLTKQIDDAEKYKNYLKGTEAKKRILELDENSKETQKSKNEAEEKGEKLLKKLEDAKYLKEVGEDIAKRLFELETEKNNIDEKLKELEEKKEEKEKIAIKNTKRKFFTKRAISLLVIFAVLFVLSAFLISVIKFIPIILMLIFALSIAGVVFDAAKKKKEAAKAEEAIMYNPEEENELLKRQRKLAEEIDKIFAQTHCFSREELIKKLAEKDSLDALFDATQNEISLLCEKLKSIEKEKEELLKIASSVEDGAVEPSEFDEEAKEKLALAKENLLEKEKTISALSAILKNYKEEKSASAVSSVIKANEEKIDELFKYYKAIERAVALLEESYEELKSDFAPKLSEKVREVLVKLTDGKYTDVRVSDDYSLKVEEQNNIVDAEYLSGGTYDVLYFALRIGILNVLYEKTPLLILDDAFLQLDEERAQNAAKYIKEEQKAQVLYFTCHQTQKEIFGTENVNVINL